MKMKEKLIRWMQGRYGEDELGRFLTKDSENSPILYVMNP